MCAECCTVIEFHDPLEASKPLDQIFLPYPASSGCRVYSKASGSQDLKMRLERLDWYKILGIYNHLNSTFRGNIQVSSSKLEDKYGGVDFPKVGEQRDNF